MKQIKQVAFGVLLVLFAWSVVCTGAWADEVVIGFTGPLSGPGAGYGRDNLNGLKMAAEDLNKAGGITVKGKKYTFKIEALDDTIDPTAAVNNARRLTSRSGAKIIYNPVFNTIAPLMQINEQRGSTFLMMAYSSTPKIEQIPNKLTVSIPPPFTAYVQAFSELAWQKGWRKAAMVVTLGAYGDEWREAFKHHWTEKGGEILADKPANYYTETDFSAQLSAALATKPDFLLIGGPSEPTGLVIEQAHNLGFAGGFMLVDQAKMDYIADVVFKGDVSKMGNVVGIGPVLGIPSPIIKEFDKRYTDTFKVHNTWEAILNYSSLMLLAEAMKKADTIDDPAAIKAAIASVVPQDPNKVPAVYYDILGTKLTVPGLVGNIDNGKYAQNYQYVWWTKDEQGYKKIVENLGDTGGVESRWLPIQGYTK